MVHIIELIRYYRLLKRCFNLLFLVKISRIVVVSIEIVRIMGDGNSGMISSDSIEIVGGLLDMLAVLLISE
jgi:hypothetical protein